MYCQTFNDIPDSKVMDCNNFIVGKDKILPSEMELIFFSSNPEQLIVVNISDDKAKMLAETILMRLEFNKTNYVY